MEEQSRYQTNNSLSLLEQAKQLMAAGKIDDSLELVKSYWLENPEDAEAASLFAHLMKESGRSELSKRLDRLAEQLPPVLRVSETSDPPYLPESPIENPNITQLAAETSELTSEPFAQPIIQPSTKPTAQSSTAPPAQTTALPGGKELFEAGYSLIDARQHELAAMLLNRAARIAPQDPTVHYELGFALMSLKHFEEALPHLELALNGGVDFDTLLNLLVCQTLTRQIEKAHDTLSTMAALMLDAEQKQELAQRHLVIKRLESLSHKARLHSRDWLYVLYGSILLHPTLRTEKHKEDAHSIGHMLAVLKGVLEGLAVVPEVIESYGVQSRPLAQALGEFLEIPITVYKGPEQPAQSLLVMTWASDIVGPHKSFLTKERSRSLFSYALPWDEALPVVPEIVGCLGYAEPMPWNEIESKTPDRAHITGQPNFTAEIQKIYKAILANARDSESDPRTIKNVQEALDYYENKKQHLILCNPQAFRTRTEYTAEVID